MNTSTVSVLDELRRQLPVGYLLAVAGIASGDTDEELAARVDVDVTAVPTLLCLTAEKLLELARAAVLGAPPPPSTEVGQAGTTKGDGR